MQGGHAMTTAEWWTRIAGTDTWGVGNAWGTGPGQQGSCAAKSGSWASWRLGKRLWRGDQATAAGSLLGHRGALRGLSWGGTRGPFISGFYFTPDYNMVACLREIQGGGMVYDGSQLCDLFSDMCGAASRS